MTSLSTEDLMNAAEVEILAHLAAPKPGEAASKLLKSYQARHTGTEREAFVAVLALHLAMTRVWGSS